MKDFKQYGYFAHCANVRYMAWGAGETIAAISAASSAAGSALQIGSVSGHSHQNRAYQRWALTEQLKENERMRQYNEKQASLNRQWYEDYYNRYQSPEAMMRQYRVAGLNPYSAVGANSTFDAGNMANAPQVDPSSLSQPYGDFGKGMSDVLTSQQQAYSTAISNGFSQLSAMAQQYLDIQKKEKENELLDQQLVQMSSYLDIFNKPIDQETLGLFPGLEKVIQKLRGGSRGVLENGTTVFHPSAKVGDLLSIAQLLRPLMELNESPSGKLPTSVQDAFYRPYFQKLAATGHSYSWDGKPRDDLYESSFGPLLAAFDVVHGSNLSGISQNSFNRWSYDWQQKLRRRGLNPDGNDLFNTALRVMYANGNDSEFDSLLHALGKTMGSASQIVGNLLDLPQQYLDAVKKWNFGKKKK